MWLTTTTNSSQVRHPPQSSPYTSKTHQMKVNSNYFNLISIEVFVWPLVDLVDSTHILDFSVHPTCVDAVMSGPMDFSMKISPEMKRNATICDIYFKIWLLGKRWPILILHSQTINTNIVNNSSPIYSGADSFHNLPHSCKTNRLMLYIGFS